MDQTDYKTPNPCILTPEQQLDLLALRKKVNIRLGTNILPTAGEITPFNIKPNLRFNNGSLDTIQDIQVGSNPTWNIINAVAGFLYNGAATAGRVLRGNGTAFIAAILAEADLSFTDITTNDVSITKHGFVPKAPNDTTKFLRGDGTWAITPDAFPLVRSSGNALAQTGAVASVTAFTTGSSGGSFEIGGYIDVTAFTAGSISMTCTYTDPSGNSKTLTMPLVSLAGTIGTTVGSLTDAQAIIISIQTSGANSITIATTVTVFTGTYNVYGWIKQIA